MTFVNYLERTGIKCRKRGSRYPLYLLLIPISDPKGKRMPLLSGLGGKGGALIYVIPIPLRSEVRARLGNLMYTHPERDSHDSVSSRNLPRENGTREKNHCPPPYSLAKRRMSKTWESQERDPEIRDSHDSTYFHPVSQGNTVTNKRHQIIHPYSLASEERTRLENLKTET